MWRIFVFRDIVNTNPWGTSQCTETTASDANRHGECLNLLHNWNWWKERTWIRNRKTKIVNYEKFEWAQLSNPTKLAKLSSYTNVTSQVMSVVWISWLDEATWMNDLELDRLKTEKRYTRFDENTRSFFFVLLILCLGFGSLGSLAEIVL